MDTVKQDEAWRIVGANIRRLRLAASKTQAELAVAVHVSQPRIAQIERGVKDSTVGLIAEIAEALGEPIDMLFRADKIPEANKIPGRRLTA